MLYEDADTLTFDASDYGYGDGDEAAHQLLPPDETESTLTYRNEPIATRKFDEKKWQEIVGDQTFEEGPVKETKPQKRTDQISLPWAGPVLQLISYIVIIGVVLLLLYLVFKNISVDMKISKAKLQTDNIDRMENIEDVDIQTLLSRARAEGDLRVAVRLYYLGLLKRLHELKMIVWKKDKTNRDYLSELFANGFHFDEVRKLTNSYESVWYGEHPIHFEAFQHLSGQFESVYTKIDHSEGNEAE